jgi:hypothetical protein
MARRRFGGSTGDWTFTLGAGNVPTLAAGAVCLFYDAQTGGSQYTDLATNADGTGPITQVVSGTGSSTGAAGQIPTFYGPDSVVAMWMSANGAPRVLVVANDIGPNLAATNAGNVFAATQQFGPVGDGTAKRVTVYAEATGQATNLVEWLSGTDLGQGGARTRGAYIDAAGQLRAGSAKSNGVPLRVAGQTGQTANLTEWTDPTGAAVTAWVDPSGLIRAPNLGLLLTITVSGALTVAVGKVRVYNDTGATLTIRSVRASVNTAPTGNSIRVDVNKNGTTIFTTQANRPLIAASANTSGKVSNMDIAALADGDYVTADVDQIGSTVAGSDLTVQMLCY